MVNAPARGSEPPPETLRSPPPPADADAATAGREIAKTPLTGMTRTPSSIFEKTLAVAPQAPPAVAKAPPIVILANAEAAEKPVAAVAEKPVAPDGAVAAADPPREEPRRVPAIAASSARRRVGGAAVGARARGRDRLRADLARALPAASNERGGGRGCPMGRVRPLVYAVRVSPIVTRTLAADHVTPVRAYAALRSHAPSLSSFLLESVHPGERWGRYSIIG